MPPSGYEVFRDTELGYDSTFVEAARVVDGRATDDWTTLEDQNGHTTTDVPENCPDQQAIHPWLTHYQSAGCEPTGTTGQWWAATGNSTDPEDPEHPEQWRVNLAAYAGGQVQISISYVSDKFSAGRRGLHRQCGGLDRRRQHLVRGRR